MNPQHFFQPATVLLICLPLLYASAGYSQESSPKKQPEVPEFRCQRPLTTAQADHPQLAALRIDPHVWEQTRDGLPDLRLIDEADHSVPFVLRSLRQTSSQKTQRRWTPAHSDLRPQANGLLQIVLQLDDLDPQPEGLTIFTPLVNFEIHLRIHAGSDTSGPLLVEDALLYDYSQFMNVRRTHVPFNSGSARTFCLVLEQEAATAESSLKALTRTFSGQTETQRTESVLQERRPIRIDRIEFQTQSATIGSEPLVETWQPAGIDVQEDAKNRCTLVTFSGSRRPLSTVTLQTSSRNFNRNAHLEYRISEQPERWQTCSSAELRKIDIGRVQETQLDLACTPERRTHWRLRIENGDNQPLNVTALELAGPASEIVWLAEPGRHFRLLYGDQHATTQQLEVRVLNAALAAGETPVPATAGPVEFRTVVPAAAPVKPQDLINNPTLLISLALLLAAGMGWALYNAAARMKQLPNEPEQGT